MTDADKIKAGTYLLVAPSWEEFTSKEPFDFVLHRRGEVLDLDATEARRLYLAGAVIPHDVDNPTHVVNADGTITEIKPPEPTGMTVDELGDLAGQLQLPPDATPADVAKGVQALQDMIAQAAQAQAEAEQKAEAAARVAADAQAKLEKASQPPARGGRSGSGS